MDKPEEKQLLECIKIIFSRCVNGDKELIERTIQSFRENEAISGSQQKKISKDLNEGFFPHAVESLMDSVCRHEKDLWRGNLLLALSDKKFPGDITMITLLVRLLNGQPVPSDIAYLIQSWEEILALQDNIKITADSTWPDEEWKSPAEHRKNWVLYLILKCHMERESREAEEFISSVKDLICQKFPKKNPIPVETDKTERKRNQSTSGHNVQESLRYLGDEDIIKCVELLICKFMHDNGDLIKDFAILFRDHDLIQISERKAIYDFVKKGNLKQAPEILCGMSLKYSGKSWMKRIAKLLADEDFPGDERLKNVLQYLCDEKRISCDIGFLIQSWDNWCDLLPLVQDLVKLSWTQNNEIPGPDDKWPLVIIMKCLVEKDAEKVTKFVADIKPVVKKKGEERRKAPQGSDHNRGGEAKKPKLDGDNVPNRKAQHAPVSDTTAGLKGMNISESSSTPHRIIDVKNGSSQMDTDSKAFNKNERDLRRHRSDTRDKPEAKDAEELKNLHSTDTSEIIEFRVVIAEGSHLPADCSLGLITNLYGDWEAAKLEKNQWGSFFSCSIPILKSKKFFQYKYFYTSLSGVKFWEKFIFDGSVMSNRFIRIDEWNSGMVFQDVVVFSDDYTKPWHILCRDFFIQHLPSAQHLILRCEKDRKKVCDFGREVFVWTRNIKDGWKITRTYGYEPFRPFISEIQKFVVQWLRKNSDLAREGTKFDALRSIISTLTLVIAMHHSNITIHDDILLKEIFQMLSVHKLSGEDQKLLYDEIVAEYETHTEQATPQLQDGLISLFRRLTDNPVAEFLFALPLYWLIADKGVIGKDVVKTQEQGGLVFKRSALPSANHLSWSEIRKKCFREWVQRELIELAPKMDEIYQLHPWIIGSLQYMLKAQSLIQLILNRDVNKIGAKFPLDAVFHQLLNACRTSFSHETKLADLASLDEYFVCTFQSLIEQAKGIEDTEHREEEVQKNLEIPKIILTSLQAVLSEIAKNTSSSSQTESRNNNVLWCLQMSCQAVELAYGFCKSDAQENVPDVKKLLVDIRDAIATRMYKCRIDDDQLRYWNFLMTLGWPDEKFQIKWREVLKNEMKQKISNAWQHKDEEFLNYYAESLEQVELDEAVESCFSEKAFKCTEDLLAKYGPVSKDRGLLSSTFRSVFSRFSTPRFIKIFDKLFNRELQKSSANFPQESFDMRVLHFLFTWPFAPQFFRLFNTKDALSKFSVETKEQIVKVVKSFNFIVDSLYSGDVLVKHLKLIFENQDKYLELRAVIHSDASPVDKNQKFLSHIIEHRWGQLQAYENTAESIMGFLSACSKLDDSGEIMVNNNALKDKIRERANANDEMLSKVSPESFLSPSNTSEVSYFNLPSDILKCFQSISSIKDSKVFHEVWYQNAVNAKNASADSGYDLGDGGLWRVGWKEVVHGIWKETHRDLMTLVQDMDSGILTLETASEWFLRCSGEPDEIKMEIQMLYDYYQKVFEKINEAKAPLVATVPKTAQEPKKQEKNVGKKRRDSESEDMSEDGKSQDDDGDSWKSDDGDSHKSSEEEEEEDMEDEDSQSPDSDEEEEEDYDPVSNIKLRTRQLCCYFQLEKAKETIDLLLQMRDELQLTGDFSSIERHKTSVENKTSSLDELPDDQEIPFVCKIPRTDVDCLRQFIKERELILWLKEKMSDISEVKVMCDLAMISAGETPYEVDIVSCLLSAVMGFAPLIFELDNTAGLVELLNKCKAVWKNRDSDEKLLEKWKDTGRQLAWFKGIENFHGSVEKQSLTLAQEINNRGIYTIKRWNYNGPLTVRDCINLVLPNKSEIEKRDTYRLDALCDLQSRLMLIAGEAEMGQTDVANFVEVLNSLQILAGTFVKLVSAGCMLFNNWSAVISCDDISSNATNNLIIQIKFGDDSQALCGTGSLAELSKLSSILNDSLERWNSHISAKRVEHYFLNEYSIQQMIYLCHELAICKDRLPDQVDALLAIVASYSSIDRLHELLNDATKVQESETKMQVDDNCDTEEDTEDDESSESRIEARMNAVREVARLEEVAEYVAKAAVQSEGHENIEKCTHWVSQNEFDKDLVKRLCEEFEKERVSQKQTKSDVDVIEEKNRVVRQLIDKDGIDEDVAKAAVQENGIEDLDECLTWALLNQYEDELISALCESFDKDAGFSHQEKELRVITSILHDRSQNTLREVIDRLQENIRTSGTNTLMDFVNTICVGYHDETRVITLQDSLSIEHLGRFLYLLHNDAEIHPICRDLMSPLQTGRPNLLVCQEQEILPSVLRLYMYNEDQPLPTTSEVLVCSEQTSIDEVERFMRRAMCNCGNKGQLLFSLAFADKLNFNVSTATEKIFNRLSQETKNDDYQLVILLSKQLHYLTTCFDKYPVEGKWLTAGADIPKYLKKHLKVHGANLRTGAACVDKENSMVRIVSSARSGVGKSLHVQRQTERLAENLDPLMLPWRRITIRLLERLLDFDYVIERLYRSFDRNSHNSDAMLVHIDLTPAVQKGINAFAFNLFVLGSIQDSKGKVWKRHPNHLYMLEMTDGGFQGKGRFSPCHILNLLPCVKCHAPREILENPTREESQEWLGMDCNEFQSDTYQRPFQYLKLYDEGWQQGNLDSFVYAYPTGTPEECIQVLLKHCCMNNPSWAQLRHFASFLNVQLQNCENSIYCDQAITGQELQGLKAFAVRFMIRMSQDFATPSLHISDESSGNFGDSPTDLQIYQFRRKWEESSHPYLFFNEDRVTMTFINVNISDEGDLLDKNGDIVEPAIISKQLVHGLKLQGVSLDLNFDTFDRERKLRILRQVIGIQDDFDPDPTYELTTDNVLKILAIYMRFRCEIPVIIMGETGCGKTRMVEFMSKLKSGRQHHEIKSMITLKIHGGITVADIHRSVAKAQLIAAENKAEHNLSTILFYDEANTTEAVYAIKEVMCDLTIEGGSFKESQLKLVAACNPYKQLSKEAIRKLEDSGLGYRIRTSDTAHLFGNIPMRTLVYRVVALPPSMQPFVWDFGQLSDEAEKMYIHQMTKKLGRDLDLDRETMRLVNAVLSEAQNYMRSRKDECRYVSLRDVERCVITYAWFHSRKDTIYPLIDREVRHRYERMNREFPDTTDNLRTLLQTIGVCYHASLDDRLQFREKISYAFGLEGMHIPELMIREEISAAQSVFLRNMKMDDNIAANEALQENVFMMTVCADMRIPLFLIGKPGSSKSLAKTIVGDNMQGNTSRSQLYKNLKQVHILSYQCSALTDAVGIESVFKQCAQLQAKQDLKSYTAVVVLDEIGLAEDSANMPLKVLHPLLECGSTSNSSLTEFDVTKKVGFVGISNWALDPAKMNRGIFVTRNKPTKEDLKKTAKGIFENQKSKINENSELLEKLTESYLKIYEGQKVEFFGLRDYYSLIKMIHTVCTASRDARLSSDDVTNAIHRNFSGGKRSHFETFRINIQHLFRDLLLSVVPIRKMISDNLREKQSRFLLLLTNQFSAASLLRICMDDFENRAQVVFGSSFPGDHNYTDICRNINRIKVCMETGRTVVLLNMTEIHESLYDALNQHYVTFGGQRYVDLGLGGHRVKCRIADNFRLIVVEQKEVVYSEYPIPLINRLEKHHLDSKSLLSPEQRIAAASLFEWTERFTKIHDKDFSAKDAFVGYHDDTICSVVLTTNSSEQKVYIEVLLESATMDGIFRLPESELGGETEALQENYLKEQFHDSLVALLKEELKSEQSVPLLEITSFSNILSETDRRQIEGELELKNGVMLLSLEQFETEQEYTNKLEEFFRYCLKDETDDSSRILLIQCSQAQTRGQLISCAKYCLLNKLKEFFFAERKAVKKNLVVALLLSTEREGQDQSLRGSLLLQHAHDNRIIYVDELRPTNSDIAPASHFYKMSLCDILRMGAVELENGRQEGSLVNIMSLLRDCICEAVAKVKSRFSESKRYFDRVKILSALFSEDNDTGAHFRKILLEKMIQLYVEREEQVYVVEGDWIVGEVCHRDSLQEGGTLRKTLWLCLKRHISRLIAFVISITDRHNNLDLLSEVGKSGWKVEMWLKIFKSMPLSWSAIGSAQEFLITAPQHHRSTSSCKVPFSFLLHEFFLAQWDILSQQNNVDMQKIFFKLFRESQLFEITARATTDAKIRNMMKLYASDLLQCIYIPGSGNAKEMEVVENFVHEFAMKQFMLLRSTPEFTTGDEIAIVFLTYKQQSVYLNLISEVFRMCPDLVEKTDKWLEEQRKNEEFIVHIAAFESMLNSAQTKADGLNDPKICLEWKNLMVGVKRIFKKLINHINNEQKRNEILRKWTPLTLVHLLVEQILPSENRLDIFEKYVSVVAHQAKLLWRGLFEKDVRSFETLRIMCNVLKRSYDDVKLKLKVKWEETSCRLCRKRVQDPTFLPCGHFTCHICIGRLMAAAETSRRCPTCAKEVPADYVLRSAILSADEEKELRNFRSNCTSFFLEYLRQFCFASLEGTHTSMMERQVQLLIAEMIVQAPDLERHELECSAIDLNINSKTAILRTLLNNYPQLTKNELNDWMTKLSRDYIKTLTTVVIKCFEDQILLDAFSMRGDRMKELDHWEKMLGAAWRNLLVKGEELTKVVILQNVAEVRCCLTEATSCIDDIFKKKYLEYDVTAKSDNFVTFVVRICCDDSVDAVLREFIIKTACRKYGSDWFHQLKENVVLEDLVPLSLNEASEGNKIDRWTLLGKSYTDEKSTLYKTLTTDVPKLVGRVLRPGQPQARLGRILSLFTWAHGKEEDVKGTITEILQQHPDAGTVFFKYLIGIHSEFLPALKSTQMLNEQQEYTLYQIVTVVVAMVTSRSHMMDGFTHLMTRPSVVANMFLPAMPENPFFSVPAEMRRHGLSMLYKCPNGHIYAIGECTQPMQTAKCADCGATIGGANHRAAAGNERFNMQDERSQIGYLLQNRGNNVVDAGDRVSKQGAAVMQFILHTSMLIGLDSEEHVILRMVNKRTKAEAQRYLVHQLQKNLQTISDALDRNMDDTVLVMHEIILRLLNQREGPTPPDWSTLEKRRQWETMCRERYLLPVFQNLDSVIMNAQERINSAENQCSMALYRLVHEVPPKCRELNITDFQWTDSMLWIYIKHSNSSNLLQYLGDGANVQEGVLRIVLDSPDLHLVKYLEPVLHLQAILIQKYQNETDMNDTEKITFKKFERDGGHSYRELMDKYIEIWNAVFHTLKAKLSHEKRLSEYFVPMDIQSAISMGLPSTRGRGQCAKILAEYLIDLQNEFLAKCRQVMEGDESIEEAEVSQLFHSHFVRIDKQEDLLPLIHMHTKYDITVDNQGRHHHISYNIDALEKQTRERFVMYKKVIAKQTLPLIQYPQDIGIGSDWDRVLSNTPQQPLSAKITQDLDRIVARVTSADVCEGVRTLTHSISFLAKVKANSKKLLFEFLEKDLLLSASRTAVIPKSVLIEHTLALYNRISWHKAVHFASRGLNPYKDALSTTEQLKITNRDVLKQLKEVFEHSDVILLQQRMNEMLIKIPDFNADWSLTDIFPYFEFIGDDGEDDSWYARLPEEIQFRHIAHLFSLAVNFTSHRA